MSRSIESISRAVRWRCSANVALSRAGAVLAALAGAGLAAIAAERLTAIHLLNIYTISAAAAVAVAATLALWLRARPTAMHVALLIDQRLGLQERFSTVLAMAGQDDPFVRSAEAQTQELADRLSAKGRFPVRLTRRWFVAAGGWAAVVAMFIWLPQMDLLGVGHKRQSAQRQAQADAAARQQVADAVQDVKAVVQKLGDATLDASLARLDVMPAGAKADEVRRDAIRKLGELDEALKRFSAERGGEQAEALRKMLAELAGTGPALRELNQELMRGQLGQAADKARELADKLTSKKLSEQDQRKAERELAELNKRMSDLADRKQQESAGQSGDRDAQRAACESMRKLAEQVGKCANPGQNGQEDGEKLSAEELKKLAEQLDQLEQARKMASMVEDGEQAIEEAVARIGQCDGECGEDGDLGQVAGGEDGLDGLALKQMKGQPGGTEPGRGSTKIDADYKGDAADRKFSAATPGQDDSPPIASWLFKGDQVRGESKRSLAETVQSARDRAAEAVTEHRVPRKYESTVKQYFDRLGSGE